MGKGNVCVIYDPDERYAKRLMGIINDDKDIPYKARMFTRKEEFNKYIAGNDTDVLMVNEECYTYEIQKRAIIMLLFYVKKKMKQGGLMIEKRKDIQAYASISRHISC